FFCRQSREPASTRVWFGRRWSGRLPVFTNPASSPPCATRCSRNSSPANSACRKRSGLRGGAHDLGILAMESGSCTPRQASQDAQIAEAMDRSDRRESRAGSLLPRLRNSEAVGGQETLG